MPTFFNPNSSIVDSKDRGPSMSERDYEIAALLSQYGPEEQEALLMAERAKQLRGTGAPQMRSAGNLIFAPHALEYMGNLAQKSVGEGMNKQATDKMRGISAGIRSGFGDLQKKWGTDAQARADRLSGKVGMPTVTEDESNQGYF